MDAVTSEAVSERDAANDRWRELFNMGGSFRWGPRSGVVDTRVIGPPYRQGSEYRSCCTYEQAGGGIPSNLSE